MIIKEVKNRKIWTEFFNKYEFKTLWQSWEWGELQRELGSGIQRCGIFKKRKIIAIFQIIKIRNSNEGLLFVPYGPLSSSYNIYLNLVTSYLRKVAEKENYQYIRILPSTHDTKKSRDLFKKEGYLPSIYLDTPENEWVVNISSDLKELLKSLSRSTRYNIRNAIRKGVKIEKSSQKDSVKNFFKVYVRSAKRKGYLHYSIDVIEKEFNVFKKNNNAIFFHGTDGKSRKILSSALVLFNKNFAHFHIGASEKNKLPITYLLHWEIIKEAKRRGCKYYNLGQILNHYDPNHPWYGFSIFKSGFPGKTLSYMHPQDFIPESKKEVADFYQKVLGKKKL